MRTTLFVLIAALAASCSKHNPESCCTTDAQCQSFGLDGIIGCSLDEVCNADGACVASECTTSSDCTDPTMPVCINQVCVASCTTDMDCMGTSGGPHCGSAGACVACDEDSQCTMATEPVCDATTSSCRACQTNTDCGGQICDTATGACVQCTSDAQCSPTMPVCDATTNACRGCEADTECPSGVCLLGTKTCADESDVRYVDDSAGTDTGTCPRSSPCASIGYAILQASGATQIIHLIGGAYNTVNEIDLTSFTGTIDGENTQLLYEGSNSLASIFAVSDGTVTFSNLQFMGSNTGVTVTGGNVVVDSVDVKSGVVISGGMGTVTHSIIDGSVTVQNSGTGIVESSTVHGQVGGRDGVLNVSGNIFDGGKMPSLSITATIVNNVFICSTDGTGYVKFINSPSATVEFNTFVNTTGATPTIPAITCATNVTAADNVVVWDSSTPLESCTASYTLFDNPAAVPAGSGNISGDPSTFFADLADENFHLASGSPAIGAADPGSTLTTDFDGNPRPNPAGSHPDIGAFEAP